MATAGSDLPEQHGSAPHVLAVNDEVHLSADEDLSDRDSAYGDEISTYTSSLSSSINTFRTEYGRTYHAYGEPQGNFLPNDEQEFERLDLHHALMLWLLDGRLHLAPIGTEPQRVIDVGTGTGNWAIDFADLYPSAEVIGTDLSPIQTTLVPPNLRFIIDDYEDEWTYERTPFDYIHGRYLATAVHDWPRLVHQTFRNLRPGGWVEFQDWDTHIYSTDGSLSREHALFMYHEHTCNGRTAAGYDSQPGPKIEGWCRDAGFINVRVVRFPIPLGTWPKDPKYKKIGICNYMQFHAGMEGIAIGCLARGAVNPWSMEEVQVLVAETRKDMKNPKLHGQYDL